MPSDRKPSLILSIAGAVLLLVGYVLGVGPAWRYCFKNGMRGEAAFNVVYAPLIWLADRSDTAARILNDYGDWWVSL